MIRYKEEFTYHLFETMKEGDTERFRDQLLAVHPADQEWIFMKMSERKRAFVYEALTAADFAELFQHLRFSARSAVMREMEESYAAAVLDALPLDELTDFIMESEPADAAWSLHQLPPGKASRVSKLLRFEKETAGSLMTPEVFLLHEEETVKDAIGRIRKQGDRAETLYYLYVTDEEQVLTGIVTIRDLLGAGEHERISVLMRTELVTIRSDQDQQEAVRMMKTYDFIALPVVDILGRLEGIITVDDIMDVMEEEATEDFSEFGGLSDVVTFKTRPFVAARKRLPWLLVLMMIGMATAGLIGFFETTLQEAAMLALFIPLVADAGGNAGTQSLAVAVRGLALDAWSKKEIGRILGNELITGLYLAIPSGLFAMLISQFLLGGDWLLGAVIGVSLMMTVLISALTGMVIPFVIQRFRIDPAVASGPFITTLNDILALMIFLTVATVGLSYL